MSNSKHTPGPWTSSHNTNKAGLRYFYISNQYTVIARVIKEDDARLIADGPDMLELLERVDNIFDGDCIAKDAETAVDCIHCAVRAMVEKHGGGR